MDDTGRISPTAHYTSWVWYRNGLSYRSLATPSGRALYHALRPVELARTRFGRPGLEEMLLARHRRIDRLLANAIESGLVGQVLEVAAGLSPRGATFARRYPGLRYVEGDLPAMGSRKRRALASAGLLHGEHRVVVLDALADAGPTSIASVAAAHLDRRAGLAVVTEGLLSYFDRPTVEALWRRIAVVLLERGRGVYLSDLNLAGDVAGVGAALPFRLLLAAFTRGWVHLHFQTSGDVEATLAAVGFGRAVVHEAGQLVRVFEASP
jgi:O-methyltransferase involved in polyketide biosynthesis